MVKKEIQIIQQYQQRIHSNKYRNIKLGQWKSTAPSQDSVDHGLVIKDDKITNGYGYQ